jgi:hypothetical protein
MWGVDVVGLIGLSDKVESREVDFLRHKKWDGWTVNVLESKLYCRRVSGSVLAKDQGLVN